MEPGVCTGTAKEGALRSQMAPCEPDRVAVNTAAGNTVIYWIFIRQNRLTFASGSKDYQFQFSVSGAAADYLRNNGLEKLDFAGMTDCIISPFASYFDKKIFYLQRLELGSFTIWDRTRRQDISSREFLEAVGWAIEKAGPKLLLITSEPVAVPVGGKSHSIERFRVTKDSKVDLLRAFEPGIVADEKYFIYLVQRVDPSKEDVSGYILLRSQ
jgi:hypothetical protein